MEETGISPQSDPPAALLDSSLPGKPPKGGTAIFSPRLRADGLLLLTAVVWGSGFVAQRVAAALIGPFTYNGARFFLGALFLLMIVRFRFNIEKHDLKGVALAGTLLFLGSWLQQAGLATTTTANASFITGLYVILVPIVLWVGWRQQVQARVWLAACLAVVGALLLSTGGRFRPAVGDALELVGSVVWALHVIIVSRQARKMDPVQFVIGQFLVCGLLNTAAALAFETARFGGFPAAFPAVFYNAVFSITIGFTLQALGQKHAPPEDAAIILSLEAVFGALFGFLLLNEGLLFLQVVGCVLIMIAVLLAQLSPRGEKQAG